MFQFTNKRLRDFIDPNHLLIQIDDQFDFATVIAPLEERYCPDFDRPAIHRDTMVGALLICSLYNIAYRWFCFLTVDDPVFDHSSITNFINRIGREGFEEIFAGLNEELLRMGLLSAEMYSDSSPVKAPSTMGTISYRVSRSGMAVDDFQELAFSENDLSALEESTQTSTRDETSAEQIQVRYFLDPRGQLPLSPVDTNARWRTTRPGKPSGLNYQENVIVDRSGFILSRGITHASREE